MFCSKCQAVYDLLLPLYRNNDTAILFTKFITCRKFAIMAPAVKTSRNLEDQKTSFFCFFSCQLNVSVGPGAEGAPLPGLSIHGNQSQRPAAAAAAGAGQHTHSAVLLSKQVSTLSARRRLDVQLCPVT